MRINEYGRLYYRQKLQNLLALCTTVAGNEQFSLFTVELRLSELIKTRGGSDK